MTNFARGDKILNERTLITVKKQMKENGEFLECEKLWIFMLMIAVGGFFGAYTYNLKGKVFCNAQTANFVMLAVQLGELNLSRAVYYLIPISAYLLGAVLSEFLPKRVNSLELLRWDTFFIGFEMLAVLAIGFVPDGAPPQICQVAVNFIASMQYNTFRRAENVPMATTFCTNHLRQVGINAVKWVHHGSAAAKHKLFMHILMLTSFIAGGILSTYLCIHFKGKAIWWSEILLFIVFADFLRADLGAEKGKIHVVPHGH